MHQTEKKRTCRKDSLRARLSRVRCATTSLDIRATITSSRWTVSRPISAGGWYVHRCSYPTTLEHAWWSGRAGEWNMQAGRWAGNREVSEAGTMRYLSMGYSLLTNYSGFRICFAKLVFFRRWNWHSDLRWNMLIRRCAPRFWFLLRPISWNTMETRAIPDTNL